ncbi:MAG: DNA repair protein RecN, partial [Rhodospirillaceae bacterium]|nr:DNA repair protein RecN [Rhodospirillaceae bacterium]
MLLGLSIRNVVLIEQLDLGLKPGLCVLTGETGAGKSILLDALGLALGFRAERNLVRAGADQAVASAEFEITADHPAHALLKEQGFESGDTLTLRRILSKDGRSRAFINDQPASVGLLRQLGDMMIEIEGQFAEQGLLNPATHRDTLDAYGSLGSEKAATAETWEKWRIALETLESAKGALSRALEEEAELKEFVDELDNLAPETGEETKLAETRTLMMHREQLIAAMNAARDGLSEESGKSGGVEDRLRSALSALEKVADKAPGKLDGAIAALERTLIECAEAEAQLATLGGELDMDSTEQARIEDRLFALRDAAKKHRVTVDELPVLRQELAARLEAVSGGENSLNKLAEAERAAHGAYTKAAGILSRGRDKAASALDAAVAIELPALKLEKAVFCTRAVPLEEADWGENGCEKVYFEVSTNPGAAPGPLNKIASGGELARFMLALKVAVAQTGDAGTLVFDEVDSGVGGAVAAAVGERLAKLGKGRQVLVITHSAQVAARGSH